MAMKHQAAVLLQKGGPLSVVDRATPDPGSNEVLIEVRAIAVNPMDYYQRDFGMPAILSYPAVIGCDVAGILTKVGANVTNAPALGSRVLAFASSFYQNGSPDHGAFQKYVLAQWEAVIALPGVVSFEEGAILPLAVLCALSGWTTLGIPIGTKYTPHDKQAVLIWGGASSVGSLAVQSAKAMGFTVYTTASTKNHEYLQKLGADAAFDYGASDVVSQIVNRVKKDGVNLRNAQCIVNGSLQPTLDVLSHTKGDAAAKVAYAPLLSPDAPVLEGVEVKQNFPPSDQAERDDHIHECFHVWLRDGLDSGTIVPSPRTQIVGGGLEGLNTALDSLKAGVSGTKLVVSV